tara:strand:- start:17871 stop:18299 length:429 start_codon:yes stop_codon:yes gene_type:complete
MDICELEDALDIANCKEGILEETETSLRQVRLEVINSLPTSDANKGKWMKALEGYQYINDVDAIEYGSYVRWVSISRKDCIRLFNGGFVIEVKIEDIGPVVVCKQVTGRVFQFVYNQCIAFIKLSSQEKIILRALDLASRET